MDDAVEQQLLALARRHGWTSESVRELRDWLEALVGATRDPQERETVLGATRLAEDEPAELPPATDRFEFRAPLGSGGMGEVFRVWDRGLRRNLALKTVRSDREDPDTVMARFVAEAQLTSQLRHPGIVPVHELGRLPDGRVYYTMREIRGTTLATLVRELHAVSATSWGRTERGSGLRELVQAFAEACDAVGHAHRRGVIHRDLKPSNLMVGEFGEVQVIDWGVAKALATPTDPVQTARTESEHDTLLGEVIGTPAYMPPEQAYGWNDRVDTRSDVYALGAVLYELLSGRPPYGPLPGRPVLSQVLEGPPVAVGKKGLDVPAELCLVVEQAMAREIGDRPADAGALGDQLIPYLRSSRSS